MPAMTPFLDQLPALLGVLLGSTATFGVTVLYERRKWRREHSVRWFERRATAYMEYAHAIKKVVWVAAQLAA
jgi:hypothetical protein